MLSAPYAKAGPIKIERSDIFLSCAQFNEHKSEELQRRTSSESDAFEVRVACLLPPPRFTPDSGEQN